MTEFFERVRKAGVPTVRISKEEWRKEYNTYSVLGLRDKEGDLIAAAEEIITVYLTLEAERQAANKQ